MSDLRMLMSFMLRHKRKLIAAIVALACIGFYPGPALEFTEVSPDKAFRLEHWRPGLLSLEYYHYARGMTLPRFVRLYSNHGNAYYGESPVLDYLGGKETFWSIERDRTVSVGGEFTFTNIPPDSEQYATPE